MVDFDALVKRVIEDEDSKISALRESNEALHALALKRLGREKEYTEFMARCKLARTKENMEEYAPYAKFYVPLYLHELE